MKDFRLTISDLAGNILAVSGLCAMNLREAKTNAKRKFWAWCACQRFQFADYKFKVVKLRPGESVF